jgi:hypothetical protein
MGPIDVERAEYRDTLAQRDARIAELETQIAERDTRIAELETKGGDDVGKAEDVPKEVQRTKGGKGA